MSTKFSLLCLSLLSLTTASAPPCRFAPSYTQESILANPNAFAQDFLYWEGRFHANDIGYNAANALTYDGSLLHFTTGLPWDKHPFSAASKEAIHVMVLAHALAGDSNAARFLAPDGPGNAPDIAYGIMKTKLDTYLAFNATFPGYGGYLPWFTTNATPVAPTSDWVNRVPGLDNGELLWAVYGAVEVLESSEDASFNALGQAWQEWLDYAARNAARVFYAGGGKVCAVTDLASENLTVGDPAQNYSCEGTGYLDDPYEGELFTWWLYFFGGLGEDDKTALWEFKSPQLVRREYDMGGVGPITVQEGTFRVVLM